MRCNADRQAGVLGSVAYWEGGLCVLDVSVPQNFCMYGRIRYLNIVDKKVKSSQERYLYSALG